MTGLVLGIDAGQSGTTAVVADERGRIVGVGVAGPIRHHAEHDAASALTAAFDSALLTAIPNGQRISLACLSLTGSAALAREALEARGDIDRIEVLESDAFAALASGVGARGGIAVIAGTGSVALARSVTAERHVLAGGWGWLMGDQGGGFALGVAALRAAALDADGTGPSTILGALLCDALGTDDLRSVYNELTGAGFDRPAIGRLARVVTRASTDGDLVATRIVDDAAEYLGSLVSAVALRAPYLDEHERVVVPAGGVLESGPVLDQFISIVARALPQFSVVRPMGPPVIGAVLLGLDALGSDVGDGVVATLRQQLEARPELHTKTTSARQDLEGTTP